MITNLILYIIISLIIIVLFLKFKNTTIKALVIEVDENHIMAMDVKDECLYSIALPIKENKDIEFKKNQEIRIYCGKNSMIQETFPASITNIEDIKIIKEKSDLEVPRRHLERIYNSNDNIYVSVNEISQTGITITVKDVNKYKRDSKYSSDYKIIDKSINDVLPNKTKNKKTSYCKIVDDNTVINTYNWDNIYGKLESGNYQFKARTQDYYINIFIDFSIDINGKITYEQPQCALTF